MERDWSAIPRADDAVLTEAVRLLAAAYHPEQIYLFGSVARGDATVDSDYDLLMVVPDDADRDTRNGARKHEVLGDLGAGAGVVIVTHPYFEKRRNLKASLPGTVLREGRLLYAR